MSYQNILQWKQSDLKDFLTMKTLISARFSRPRGHTDSAVYAHFVTLFQLLKISYFNWQNNKIWILVSV